MNKFSFTQPAPTRAGAQDALKVPSLSNGQRTPYKPPSAICVGLNKITPVGYPR